MPIKLSHYRNLSWWDPTYLRLHAALSPTTQARLTSTIASGASEVKHVDMPGQRRVWCRRIISSSNRGGATTTLISRKSLLKAIIWAC